MQSLFTKNTTSRDGECHFQGIPYAEFDQTGHWSVWSIIRLFEAARLTIALYNDSLKRDIESDTYAYVIRKQKLKFSQAVHDNVSLFSRFLPKVTYELIEVGNSSFTIKQLLLNRYSGSSEVFAEDVSRMVRVDLEGRKPVALPSEFTHGLSNIHKNPSEIWQTTSLFPEKLQDKPLYTMSICVPYSDTDSLTHLTHAMYSKYYTDCATNAIKFGLYRHFREDICWYPLLELDIEYMGDVTSGEAIEVRTWQGENPQNLYFETRRKESVVNSAVFVMGLEKSRKNRVSKV